MIFWRNKKTLTHVGRGCYKRVGEMGQLKMYTLAVNFNDNLTAENNQNVINF